jgi:hypothetical protein
MKNNPHNYAHVRAELGKSTSKSRLVTQPGRISKNTSPPSAQQSLTRLGRRRAAALARKAGKPAP